MIKADKSKIILIGAIILYLAPLLCAQERKDDPFTLLRHPRGTQIEYHSPSGARIQVSRGLSGHHMAPALHRRDTSSWVLWEIAEGQSHGIGLFEVENQKRQTLFPPGLQDIGQIEPIWDASGEVTMLVYIAKRKQLDIECLDLRTKQVIPLTHDRAVEHGFSIHRLGDCLQIEIEHLDERLLIGFDPIGRTVTPLRRVTVPRPAIKRPHAARESESEEKKECFLAFGDSITWGKMYLPDRFPGENGQHKELAYPHRLHTLMEGEGFTVRHTVAGFPGETTRDGRSRLADVIDDDEFTTLIVMFGTNDTYMRNEDITIEASLENMDYIIEETQKLEMRVLTCTIPPRNDQYDDERTRDRTQRFNQGLRQIVAQRQANLVENFEAFTTHQPTEGWKGLLEAPAVIVINGTTTVDSGCHPNPDGHALMADLMMEINSPDFVRLSPPSKISFQATSALRGTRISWSAPPYREIDHYRMELGLQRDRLNESLELFQPQIDFLIPYRFFSTPPNASYRIIRSSPGGPKVICTRPTVFYFRLITVNPEGRESTYSPLFSFELGQIRRDNPG